MCALASGAAASPPIALAAAGTPPAGSNCKYQDGKISGRGSDMQTWLQYDLMGAYASDVCGSVSAQTVTYTGPGTSGSFTFTVTDQGTFVNSYEVSGVHGTASDGSGCTVTGAGDAGVWPGAAITNGSFAYDVGTAILFNGTVTGSSASGTFRFDQPPQGASLGCDTGVVNWSANLTETPPAGTNGGDTSHPVNPVYTQSGGGTYKQDWMTAYNYTSAQSLGLTGANAGVGSAAGQAAIGCFAEAYAGSDVPVIAGQLAAIDNGSYTNVGGSGGDQLNGEFCNPQGLFSPFTPTLLYPNPGDSASLSPAGIMVFPIGISAVSVFANLPAGCLPSGGLHLSAADMLNIWGGTYTNWDQVTDAGIPAGSACTAGGGGLAITRDARSDNAGTTQALDDYLADVSGYGATDICATNNNPGAASWKSIQNAQPKGGSDVNWPTGGGCSALSDGQAAGGPALIAAVENQTGAIGYADVADTEHDPAGLRSSVPGYVMTQFNLAASSGSTPQPAATAGGGSNCSTAASLPGVGTGNAAVGLGGTWNLTAQSAPNQGVDDITYAREGASYPICYLTWDMVWTGVDGQAALAPLPANLSAVSPGASSIPIDPATIAGTPNQGSFSVAASDGTDNVSYARVSVGGTASAPTYTLTGVTGVTGTIAAETTFAYPLGTGGPEANLTADQRRTLYSYFTYLTSPAAQNTLATAGYAPLPASWLTPIRQGLQANF
jgi:hypothetical protein